jgi:hypothetical protein
MTDVSERTAAIALAFFIAVAFVCMSLMALVAAGWLP